MKMKGHKPHLHDDYDIWEFTKGICLENNLHIAWTWVKGHQDDDCPLGRSIFSSST